MSYFDDASLVMIPSGYKTSKVYSVKPTSGDGDLTFTRSNSTATRVGPDGLIEKVRTNLILQSETFDNASWSKTTATVTANTTTAPNGTTTADTFDSTGSFAFLSQSPTLASGSIATYSVYIKNIDAPYVNLQVRSTITAGLARFDFTGATLTGSTLTTGISANFTDVGSGWYRCTLSCTTSEVNQQYRIQLANSGDSVFLWGAMAEVGDVMTDYIATTTAAVSVGPVANVPRLDYLNSSCPRLLLEPQRTNITLYSEQMNNAAWAATNCTVSANAVTSPDGYTNADNISTTAANSYFAPVAAVTISADASTYTQSIFVKWVSGSEVVKLRAALTGGTSVAKETIANIRTGVITSTDTTAQIVSYGNGWYRLSQQVTNNSTNTNFNYQFYPTNDGTNTNVISLWGAMAEVGSYVTSYIPTLGSSSTRGADAASKTGISSLIGQTEGTIFFDAKELYTDGSRSICILYTNGSSYIQIYLVNDIRIIINGSFITQGQNIAANTRYKIAFAYKAGQHALYVNGVQIATSSSSVAPTVLNDYYLGNAFGSEQSGNYTQALLFKTRLTNAQLAELTTL
jgi:hypothetical protein